MSPQAPEYSIEAVSNFFQKFAEIFGNESLSAVSMTLVLSCSLVSTTPAINPCHEFLVIASVIEMTPETGCVESLWTGLFMAIPITLLVAMSDFGSWQYRHLVLAALGALGASEGV